MRWYVNRIYDDAERLRILQLLVERKQYFVVNDFNLTEYAKVDFRLKDYFGYRDVLRSKVTMKGLSLTDFKYARAWDMIFEAKNHYIVHNNQARNAMISLGRDAGATYILPWDGNCFLNAKAWTNITSSISTIVNNASIINNSTAANSSTTTAHLLLSSSSTKYFYVPMARMKNDGGNALLKTSDYVPNSMPDEPQLIFHRSANATFDETKPYGYRPKVDLLWRLRIPEFQFRDRQGRVLNKTMAWKHVPDIPGYDSVRPVGWTARLFSGARSLEGADANTAIARGWSRSDGLEQLAARASLRYAERHLNYSRHSSTLLYNRRLLPLRASRMNNSFARVLAFAQTDPPPPLQSSSLSSSEFNPMNVSALAKHAMAVSIVQRVEQGSSTNYYKATVDGVLQWFTTVQPQSVLLSGDVCTLIHTCALVDSSRLLVDKQDATNSVLDVAQRQRQQHVVSKWARDMSDLMTAAIQNVDNDPDTTRTAVRQKWMPVYFSQTRDAVLFETAAACIAAAAAVTSSSGSAGGGSNKVMMDRFHMSLRHTSLARLRLHDMYPLDGNADTNQTTYNKREGLRGLMPWFLLASVGERFGVDIWRYLPPAERKRAPSSIENQRLPLLIHGIRKTLLDAEQRDDAREVKLVAWVRAMVRRKFSRSEAIDAGVTDIEEIEDEQVLDKTNSEDIDRAIPPFFELGI